MLTETDYSWKGLNKSQTILDMACISLNVKNDQNGLKCPELTDQSQVHVRCYGTVTMRAAHV